MNHLDTKVCSGCNQGKPLSEFYTYPRNGKRYNRSECKKCHSYRNRKLATPEKQRQYFLKYKYNLTEQDIEELKSAQDYVCTICKEEPEVWNVDHDHSTGRVRGMLCWNCNTGIGKLGDDPNRVLNAFTYLLEVE